MTNEFVVPVLSTEQAAENLSPLNALTVTAEEAGEQLIEFYSYPAKEQP